MSFNTAFDFLTEEIMTTARDFQQDNLDHIEFTLGHHDLRIKLVRRLHNWSPCVDVWVDGLSWECNNTITDPDEREHWWKIWHHLEGMMHSEKEHRRDVHVLDVKQRIKNLELIDG